MQFLSRILFFCLLLKLTSCATVDRRIQRNQEAFDQLPQQTQERIRRGEIAIGDSPDAVRIAKGEPRHKSTRITNGADVMIWRWTMPRTTSSVQPVYLNGRYSKGGTQLVNVDQVQEIETLRVEFLEGEAVVIEELEN